MPSVLLELEKEIRRRNVLVEVVAEQLRGAGRRNFVKVFLVMSAGLTYGGLDHALVHNLIDNIVHRRSMIRYRIIDSLSRRSDETRYLLLCIASFLLLLEPLRDVLFTLLACHVH